MLVAKMLIITTLLDQNSNPVQKPNHFLSAENAVVSNAYQVVNNSLFSWRERVKLFSEAYTIAPQEFKKLLLVFLTYTKGMKKFEKKSDITPISISLTTTAISLNCKRVLEFLKNKGQSFTTDSNKTSYLADCIEAMHLARSLNEPYDATIFDYLLEQGASLDSPSLFVMYQPLFLALKYGFEDIARKLIRSGAYPEKQYNDYGMSDAAELISFPQSIINTFSFKCLQSKNNEMKKAQALLTKILTS